MTSKGQITVPKDVREDLGLVPGSKVMFVKLPNGQYNVVPRTGKIQDLFGMLHQPGVPAMTIEEINDAIAEGGAESGMRGMEG
ncbi:AbrB/MazE/SpoVT family DNA-binding domain-containing protein [Microbacterium tenebrionis]|uniref:AbrB/MazE/SpoVT family DNA-binding domain-containing protein n=2 Tax=Microbacterium tenebrionis TaxID=2830665 RepID=A0A9X1LM88_9MICO|nr:AbrB/MazE/SpoVT family DNA-binding domain-containing protein [Microbacterium ihumii]MCC2028238.1 AbrB/MazE/SpoVT family DNA-binding domain-containing protein [Microbacterium tenebrionis]